MAKLENTILYILQHQPNKEMAILRLAKYLYLSDYLFAKSFGGKETFTGSYSRYEYGPVPTEFYPAIRTLISLGSIDRNGNIISLLKTDENYSLTKEEKACLDKIINDFANNSLSKVMKSAYATEPRVKILEQENSIGGEKLLGEEINFTDIKVHSLLAENDLDLSFMDSKAYKESIKDE